MKICYINNTLDESTGQGRLAFEMVKGAIDNGIEVTALVRESSGLSYEKVLLGSPKTILKNYFKIRNVLKECDIIHAFDGWVSSVAGFWCSVGLKKKLVVTGVGSATVKPLYSPIKRFLLSKSYQGADSFVAISRYTAQEVKKIVPGLDVEIINPGVTIPAAHNCDPNTTKEIEKLKPYILSVGTLKERKGYKFSVPAFIELKKKMPDLNYVVVVNNRLDKPYTSSMIKFINNHNQDNKIRVLNHISQECLDELYRHAELFMLLPQNDNFDFEGFGMVFTEAAVWGVPSISTLGNGSEDAVLDQKTGLLIPQGEIKMAVAAAEKILFNKELRNSLGQNALGYARGLSWDSMVQKYLSIYSKISNQHEKV
jgi:glycosyltransferase involved in cell wall biosynthesis